MSGADDDRDARAAEYVLGTATAQEAAETAHALASDPLLAEAVAAWERRLAPLGELVVPEAPPPDLWPRISAQIEPGGEGRTRADPGRPGWSRLLRAWAIGATAATVALGAALLFDRQPPAVPLTTVLLADRTQTAWSAWVDQAGALRLALIVPAGGDAEPPLAVDRVRQLWALPPGATAPTSLALLAPGERRLTIPALPVTPMPGMLVEITLEPLGGSPTGRPTGPVLFIGRLRQAGPDI